MENEISQPPKPGFNFGGLIGGLAGGIGSLASSILNAKYGRESQEAQNRANMKLAEYQYNKDLQMFNTANQYNSPMAQMQRFKDAGLNPNLIYGQGNPGNAPNVLPRYQSPDIGAKKFNPVNPIDTVQSVLSTKLLTEQLAIAKADRRIKEQEATKREANLPFYNQNALYGSNILQSKQYQEELKSLLSQWEKKSLSNNSYGSWWELKPELKNLWSSHLFGKYSRNEALLNQYNSSIALTNARKDLLDLDIKNYVPKWLQGIVNLGGSAVGGIYGTLTKAKIPKGVDVYNKNLGGGTYQSLRRNVY